MRVWPCFLAACAVAIAATTLAAQEARPATSRVFETVVDHDGKPVTGAEVETLRRTSGSPIPVHAYCTTVTGTALLPNTGVQRCGTA